MRSRRRLTPAYAFGLSCLGCHTVSAIQIGQKSYEPQQVIEQAAKGSGWLAVIALFSLINSVLMLFKAKISFVIGLGATQVVDAIVSVGREQASGAVGTVMGLIGLCINLVLIGVIVTIWLLSKRGNRTAYLVGMVLYLLDGLIFLMVRDWVGVGFHAFFLFGLWGGYAFVKEFSLAQALLAQSITQTSQTPQPSPL